MKILFCIFFILNIAKRKFKAKPIDIKKLRTAIGGMLENLQLVIRTLKEFGN